MCDRRYAQAPCLLRPADGREERHVQKRQTRDMRWRLVPNLAYFDSQLGPLGNLLFPTKTVDVG